MRLAAQAKGGYYAAAPQAVEKAVQFLKPPSSGKFSILDCCCGEAFALKQLSQLLGCDPERTYGIELEATRAAASKALLPESKIMGPASFFGTRITFRSFSFVWCNPPFDDNIGGGGRVETSFVSRATDLLCTDGVLALVCPERVTENMGLRRHLLAHFDDLCMTAFPDDVRPYNEVIVFGIKRDRQVDHPNTYAFGDECPWAEPGKWVYDLPHQRLPPGSFMKTEMTPEELSSAVLASPLHRLLFEHRVPPVRRPPLPLGKGHRALLLTAGHLDGIVSPPGELPHVVRGTARKIDYVSGVTEREKDDGSIDTITTHSQKISLLVRVVESSGVITTFNQDPNLEIVTNDKPKSEQADDAAEDTIDEGDECYGDDD